MDRFRKDGLSFRMDFLDQINYKSKNTLYHVRPPRTDCFRKVSLTVKMGCLSSDLNSPRAFLICVCASTVEFYLFRDPNGRTTGPLKYFFRDPKGRTAGADV